MYRLQALLRDIPVGVDPGLILAQFKAIRRSYAWENRAMPSPVWAERGFEENGMQACKRLERLLSADMDTGALSIYIHVPFCDRRCGFCDCYAIPLGRIHGEKRASRYVNSLLAEMRHWAAMPSVASRPVTTVHLGGGTPNILEPDLLAALVRECRICFHTHPDTEWALESTASMLTDEHRNRLWELGFRRLHVGVQTLEEPLRQRLGRRQSARTVLHRITRSLEMGFTTSVDVIFGLPGQTPEGLLRTLKQLLAVGIHGVSLYRLNLSLRNRGFLQKLEDFYPDLLYDYVLFQAADQFLARQGYQKNHFAHFAVPRDRNLYFTHPQRGEDLLALGATADGVFKHYHYRYPGFRDFLTTENAHFPSLQGGLMETEAERMVSRAADILLGGSGSVMMLAELGLETLLERWRESSLVAENPAKQGWFALTANGSWFVRDMMLDLRNSGL
jgi:anaerobilin synthase